MNEIFSLLKKKQRVATRPRRLASRFSTEADTIKDLHANVRDAVRCHFDEGKAPRMIRLHSVHEEVLAA